MKADGYRVEPNLDAAFRHWELAAVQGSDEAMSTEAEFFLGWNTYRRATTPKDVEAARRWLESASRWGDLDACVALYMVETSFPSSESAEANSFLGDYAETLVDEAVRRGYLAPAAPGC